MEVVEKVNPFARRSNVMTAEPLSADDSLGTLESLDITDSFATKDTLMTLPYRAEEKEYGTWVIMRDYTPGDGVFDYELFETMCIKAKGTKFVGQPTDINSNNFVWGAIKNKQGKIKINYATDEASGVDEVVKIEVNYNAADPYNWVGSWTSKTQSGDARVEFLHTRYWYEERGCYDALGL
jgi:hypothetical protein